MELSNDWSASPKDLWPGEHLMGLCRGCFWRSKSHLNFFFIQKVYHRNSLALVEIHCAMELTITPKKINRTKKTRAVVIKLLPYQQNLLCMHHPVIKELKNIFTSPNTMSLSK